MEEPRLSRALQIVTGARPTRSAVRVVVDRCHRMACAYLRMQQQSGALREDVLGADVEDLAMDTIAELFERDAEGQFPELQAYFDERDLTTATLNTIEDDLRRLVVSSVTDGLFEAYQTADRSLSNLIRALKRTIKEHDDVHVQRRGKTLWLEIEPNASDGAREEARPQASGRRMPMETLEAHLTGAVADGPSTGELLDVAIQTLLDQPDAEPAYPLTRLAQVMRAARVRVQAVTEHDGAASTPDWPLLQPDELNPVIERVLKKVREEKRSTYVDTGKVQEQTYAAYFRALRDRIDARFVPPGDPEKTHFEALSAQLPELTQEEYREEHRARFEYLDQLVREALVERLRNVV